MSDAFTLRVYVPSGDAEGARIVDRMNWTGRGYFIARGHWPEVRLRTELQAGGVYVLIGYRQDELGAEKPLAYIGQTDNLRKRIDQHDDKEFWTTMVLFLSTAGGLNRAHTTWLERALLSHGRAAKRSDFENAVAPAEPLLNESEKADTRSFLHEMLRMMPPLGIHIFEPAKSVTPTTLPPKPSPILTSIRDTVVVPAQKEGFERAFLRAHAWWAIRIAAKHIANLKWIAAYQVAPVSAITHIAPIARFEPFGDEGKYKVVFAGPPVPLARPVPFGSAISGAMQGPRYTTRASLDAARSVADMA